MSHTFLIAAHDPWVIQLFRIYAEESGFRVLQVYESQDIFKIIQAEVPAVILIESDIPGQMKGGEVLLNLRSNRGTHNIPVLVFSWQEPGFNEKIIKDSTVYVQGPVTYSSFLEALKKVGIYCPVNS